MTSLNILDAALIVATAVSTILVGEGTHPYPLNQYRHILGTYLPQARLQGPRVSTLLTQGQTAIPVEVNRHGRGPSWENVSGEARVHAERRCTPTHQEGSLLGMCFA